MKTLLYLDDRRNPHKQTHIDTSFYDKVVWITCYTEFANWIFLHGLPDSISFDHDLSPEHYAPKEHWVGTYRLWREENKSLFPTGLDCAKLLVIHCNNHGLQLPIWTVHSLNPIGSYEITHELMTYAEKFYIEQNS
jgi:hypothetical protein